MVATIPNEDRIAIAEVDYIIHHMNERYLNKIPQKILDYIAILKKRNIEIYVDPKLPLENQGLQEFTLHFLMVLNLKYWCNEERRQEILMLLENNQNDFNEKVNNIFEQAETMQGDTSLNKSSSEDLSKPKEIIKTNVVVNNEEKNENVEIISKSKEKGFFGKLVDKIKSIFIKK